MLVTSAQTRDYYRGLALGLTVSKALRDASGLHVWQWETNQRETILGDSTELDNVTLGLAGSGVLTVNLLNR